MTIPAKVIEWKDCETARARIIVLATGGSQQSTDSPLVVVDNMTTLFETRGSELDVCRLAATVYIAMKEKGYWPMIEALAVNAQFKPDGENIHVKWNKSSEN